MSNRLLSLVFGVECFGRARLGLARRMVMVSLADRVCGDDADTCYPGVPDIAARTELGVSTVRRVLAGLKGDGWISSTQKPGYGNVFRLNVDKLQASQRAGRCLQRATRLLRPASDRDVETEAAAGPADFSTARLRRFGRNDRCAGMTERKANATATEGAGIPVSPPVVGGPVIPDASGLSLGLSSTALSPPVNDSPIRKNPENPNPSAADRSRRAAEGKGNILGRKPNSGAGQGAGRDARHAACRELIRAMQERLGVVYPWSAACAGQLGSLLRSRPGLTVEEFGQWLRNLAASEDEWARKRTSQWLPCLQEYSRGPLDRHRRLQVGGASSWAGSGTAGSGATGEITNGTAGSSALRRKSAAEKYLEMVGEA